jgi:hypothetical protein
VSSQPGAVPCKHFDVCGLPATVGRPPIEFCVLHHPEPQGKNHRDFDQALTAHLSAGQCSLRDVVFPAGLPPNLENRTFQQTLDLSGVRFAGVFGLSNTRLSAGLRFTGDTLGALHLRGAQIDGEVRVEAKTVSGDMDFDGANVRGPVLIQVEQLFEIRAHKTEFADVVTLSANRLRNLARNTVGARFLKGLKLVGSVEYSIPMMAATQDSEFIAEFSGVLEWQCAWAGRLDLSHADFADGTVLKLIGSSVKGGLQLPLSKPLEVHVDAASIEGDVVISTSLGREPLRLVAAIPPRLYGRVTLHNVNLDRCCLLGNRFGDFELVGVRWHRRRGRWALYDETLFHMGVRAQPRDIREGYQALKETYKRAGDHVRSGDFHYGEVEMRRREYPSLWQRVLWPEAWYWLTSGYGTRPLRAFCVLAAIILICGSWFLWNDARFFQWSEFNALRFSLAVATLQRPEIPQGFSELGQWLYRVEAVVAPIQAAMFGLALRMRLKR